MKILYCYSLNKNDGGSVHADEFIHAFRELGNQIDVVFQNAISLEKPGQNMGFIKKVLAKFIWLYINVQLLNKVIYFFIIKRPDAIVFRHTTNHNALLAQLFINKLLPLVLEVNAVTEMERTENTSKIRVILDKITLKMADKIFVVSTQLKQYLISQDYCHASKIAVIENGVDTNRFYPKIDGTATRHHYGIDNSIVIGFVGTFKIWHGVFKILDLARELRDCNCKFLLVGDGECKSSCEEYVNQHHLNDTVIFSGLIPHEYIPEHIAAMDILLAPFDRNYYESQKGFFGSALKIFEYMAMAKPIITPPMGQLEEVIIDAESGRLIFSENMLELKNELLKMCADSNYRNYIGKNARHRVEMLYTWQRNAERVHNLCLEAMMRA